MTHPRIIRALSAAFCVMLTLGACRSSANDPLPSITGTAPATSATPTPTPLTPEEQAQTAAKAVIQAYWASIPKCLHDPVNTPITCFDDVAITTALDNLKSQLTAAQSAQTVTSGEITVVSMDLKSVDLTNRPSETPPTVPHVTYRVCVDVSRLTYVGKDGKSLFPTDRRLRTVTDMTVANYVFPDSSKWRVAYLIAQQTAC